MLWASASTPPGPSTRFKTKFSIATGRNMVVIITTQATTINHKLTTIKIQPQPTQDQDPPTPYMQGTAKSFKHICGKYGIKVHFKGNTTIKQLLMNPMEKKSGVIYSCQYNNLACDEKYIREIARTLGERCKEHLKQPSPIHVHIQQTGHNIADNSFNIIGRVEQGQGRTIKESIYIRVNNPTLNQNIGKYNLSHIWDRVLFNTPGLKLGSYHQPGS